jgi:hypothetical protein
VSPDTLQQTEYTRGVDRGTAHSSSLTRAKGFVASYRAEQRHVRADRGSPTDRSDRLRTEPLQPRASNTDDALVADLAREGIAYVPFFPLGRVHSTPVATLSDVAARLGATPMQVELVWLLQRSTNILVIPGTSSIEHLRENLQSSMLQIPEVIADLDAIGGNA